MWQHCKSAGMHSYRLLYCLQSSCKILHHVQLQLVCTHHLQLTRLFNVRLGTGLRPSRLEATHSASAAA
jgi:hypothetical protein